MFIWCNYNAILLCVKPKKRSIFNIGEEDLEFILGELKTSIVKLRNSKIFITGGTGFFGKSILSGLLHLNLSLNLNIKIFVLSRNPKKFKKKFPEVNKYKDLFFIEGKVANFSTIENGFTHIIHGATEASIEAHQKISDLSEVIIDGTRNILNFADKKKISNILYISSGSVYGKQSTKNFIKVKENSGFFLNSSNFTDTSGILKKSAELLCNYWASEAPEKTIKIARCFSFIGPWLPIDSHFAVGNFIKSATTNSDIIIHSDGSSLRSYLYTSDLVIWLFKILLFEKKFLTINVGSDEAYSLYDIAYLLKKLTGKNIKILTENKPELLSTAYVPNINLAKKNDLKVYTSFEDSLMKTFKFYKSLR